MNGQPKPGFYIAVALVVLGLVIFAVVRSDIFAPKADNKPDEIDPAALKAKAEAPDDANVTTVKEYTFVPSEKLPEVKGASEYAPLDSDNTVRFALNVWAGWAPIILRQQRLQGGQGLEDARRQGLQGRAGADRQPGGDARRLRRGRRPHRLGHARHGAAVHGGLRR